MIARVVGRLPLASLGRKGLRRRPLTSLGGKPWSVGSRRRLFSPTHAAPTHTEKQNEAAAVRFLWTLSPQHIRRGGGGYAVALQWRYMQWSGGKRSGIAYSGGAYSGGVQWWCAVAVCSGGAYSGGAYSGGVYSGGAPQRLSVAVYSGGSVAVCSGGTMTVNNMNCFWTLVQIVLSK